MKEEKTDRRVKYTKMVLKESFISLLKPFGIVKMVRSGISALERD